MLIGGRNLRAVMMTTVTAKIIMIVRNEGNVVMFPRTGRRRCRFGLGHMRECLHK